MIDLEGMSALLDKQMQEAMLRCDAIEQDYATRALRVTDIGARSGPVHAASVLIWNEIARRVGVPAIEGAVVATIPMTDAWAWVDNKPVGDPAPFNAATAYADAGGFWRTELCAGEQVKYEMGSGADLSAVIPFSLDDPRIMDMHWGMPCITIVGRPRLTPVRVNGCPVEFRTFFGGQAEDGAVSFYYPQAGGFDPDPALTAAMRQSVEMGRLLYDHRARLGLVPWLPENGEPDERIGATIDFMLSEERGLVMVDAGPGFGSGAHPCCFIDRPVAGEAWRLADGMDLR